MPCGWWRGRGCGHRCLGQGAETHRVAGDLVRPQFSNTSIVSVGEFVAGRIPFASPPASRRAGLPVRPVHGPPAGQAGPSESSCDPGRVCAVAHDGFPVRTVLTDRRCRAYKVASTASYEPTRFAEGAPMLIQSPPGHRLRSRPAPRLHSLTHSLTHAATYLSPRAQHVFVWCACLSLGRQGAP